MAENAQKVYDVWYMEQNHVVNAKFSTFTSFPSEKLKLTNSNRLSEYRFKCGKLQKPVEGSDFERTEETF